MSKPDIWMPLYVGDYLADTMALTTEQHGAYLLLLIAEWMRGPLPDDDKTLATITHLSLSVWESAKQVLRPYFQCNGGTWTNRRVEKEREHAANLQKRASAGGRALKAKREAQKSANDTAKEALSERQTSAKPVLKQCTSPSPINTNTLAPSAEGTAHSKPSVPLSPGESWGTLPLVDRTEYEISEEQVEGWIEAYPAVDVRQQLLKMREWLKASPKRCKTRSGIVRFIVSWLGREQDKGGSTGTESRLVLHRQSEQPMLVLHRMADRVIDPGNATNTDK